MNRKLGRMGETTFENLCLRADLVAQKPTEDMFGWDYLVEFPYDTNNKIPIDTKSSIECKVQVKSTNKRDRNLYIKASVLDRLVKYPLPSFIVFLEFDEKDEVQSIFVKHIDKDIIYKTLELSRKLEFENISLNKRTIQVHYDDCKIIKNNGAILKQTIENYIPNGIKNYIKWKGELLSSLGYENSQGSMKLTFNNQYHEDIIDSTLGIKSEPLDVDDIDIEMMDKRFGIELPINYLISPGETIKSINFIANYPKKANALIVLVAENKEVIEKLDATVIQSPFSHNELTKYKVDTEFFSFIITIRNGTINFNELNLKFDYLTAQPLLLNDVIKYFKIHNLYYTHSKNISQKLLIKGVDIVSLKIEKESINKNLVTTYRVAKKLRKILDQLGVYDDIELQVDDLENNREVITDVHSILYDDLNNAKISFKSSEYQDFDGYYVSVYSPFILNINSHIYGAWILHSGKIKSDGYSHKVNIDKVQLKKANFEKEQIKLEYFEEEYQKLLKLDNANKNKVAIVSYEIVENYLNK